MSLTLEVKSIATMSAEVKKAKKIAIFPLRFSLPTFM